MNVIELMFLKHENNWSTVHYENATLKIDLNNFDVLERYDNSDKNVKDLLHDYILAVAWIHLKMWKMIEK